MSMGGVNGDANASRVSETLLSMTRGPVCMTVRAIDRMVNTRSHDQSAHQRDREGCSHHRESH